MLASVATVQACRGGAASAAGPDRRRRPPGRRTTQGGSESGRSNHERSNVISSRSSRRSSTASCPGSSRTTSVASRSTSGVSSSSARSTIVRGRLRRSRRADLALELVDAGQQHRLPHRTVAPAADALVHLLLDAPAVPGRADLSRADHHARVAVRVVGDGPVVGPGPHDDVARVETQRLLLVRAHPEVAADDGGHRQRRLVLETDRPGRVEEAAQEERAPSAGTVEQARETVHATKVDALACFLPDRPWIVQRIDGSVTT